MNNDRRRTFKLENTRFIFRTNFSGKPDDNGNTARKATIIIPDEATAIAMSEMGLNVKQTKPATGETDGFIPSYYVNFTVNYKSEWPPHVYLVSGNSDPVLLDEETVGRIDGCYVLNVNGTFNPYYSKKYRNWGLYCNTMYVEIDEDDDPFADYYRKRSAAVSTSDTETEDENGLPFD